MYASVHTDRSGRVFVSADHGAAGMGGLEATAIDDAVPLPSGARVVPLAREATAYDRTGRIRALGKGRLALGAILQGGHARLLFPAYRDDPGEATLEPLAYAAVAADARGDLVVAAADLGLGERPHERGAADPAIALRERPANALVRQLARCARDHACLAARSGFGHGDLPVPLGAPPAERPTLPVALRSGYGGSPSERAAFHPTAPEIADVAADHVARGGTRVSFGRACDGEPLRLIRVLEDAIALIRERAPSAAVHLETAGSDPAALRRAIDAGLASVTVRLGAARADTFELLHGPLGHRWTDVRACLQLAAERGVALTIALLTLPGMTDRPAEIDALLSLLGELPGGRLEVRDLGADPLRTLAGFPRARPLGMRALLGRLTEADHFRLGATVEAAAGH